jgi:hypothetical protein
VSNQEKHIIRSPIDFGKDIVRKNGVVVEHPPVHALGLRLHPRLLHYEDSLAAYMRLVGAHKLYKTEVPLELSPEERQRFEQEAKGLPIIFEKIIALARFERLPNPSLEELLPEEIRAQLAAWQIPQIISDGKIESGNSTGGRKFAVEVDEGQAYYKSLLALLIKINPIYRKYPPKTLLLTIKGTGSQRTQLLHRDAFKNPTQIDGRGTHHPNDVDIPERLQGKHRIIGLNGKKMNFKYIPARYLVLAMPINKVGFINKKTNLIYDIVELPFPNSEMPLATGKNQLHVEAYIETGGIDLHNLINELQNSYPRGSISFKDRQNPSTSNKLDSVVATIRRFLAEHPHFKKFILQTAEMKSVEFWIAYAKKMIELSFYNAQVEAKLVYLGNNRSPQNTLIDAGITDFDDSILIPEYSHDPDDQFNSLNSRDMTRDLLFGLSSDSFSEYERKQVYFINRIRNLYHVFKKDLWIAFEEFIAEQDFQSNPLLLESLQLLSHNFHARQEEIDLFVAQIEAKKPKPKIKTPTKPKI